MHTSRRIPTILGLILMSMPSVGFTQDSDRTVELYHIFDLRTDVRKSEMIAALTSGLHTNVSGSHTMTPLVMDQPPAVPGRFKLVDPTRDGPLSGLAGLMGAAQAARLTHVTCSGAVWIATAERHVRGAQDLQLTLCLFPYTSGYQLDIYGLDVGERGGGVSSLLGRAIGKAIAGNPEDWTTKTITDLVRTAKVKTNSKVTYIEGQPDLPAQVLADLTNDTGGNPSPPVASTPSP